VCVRERERERYRRLWWPNTAADVAETGQEAAEPHRAPLPCAGHRIRPIVMLMDAVVALRSIPQHSDPLITPQHLPKALSMPHPRHLPACSIRVDAAAHLQPAQRALPHHPTVWKGVPHVLAP
jgi:hypothetical protein